MEYSQNFNVDTLMDLAHLLVDKIERVYDGIFHTVNRTMSDSGDLIGKKHKLTQNKLNTNVVLFTLKSKFSKCHHYL